MAKIFQFDNSKVERKNRAEPMDADLWFRAQQPLLLWMANKSSDGRKLLRLDQVDLPRIDRIGMNYVSTDGYVRDGGFFVPKYRRVTTTDFRIEAKWANLINYQWDWFCELSKEYYSTMEKKGIPHVGQWLPVVLRPGFQYGTTSTFYPDANVESTSVDGTVSSTSDLGSWANSRNAASGDASQDATASSTFCETWASGGTQYTIRRGFFLFDTSAIPDTDVVSAATFSLAANGSAASDGDASAVHVVATTPASNTALVTGDYDQVGSTSFGSMNISSWVSTDTTYNDFSLNASGLAAITATGVTKLGLREGRDLDNNAPAGRNYVAGYFADQAGTSSDPKLVVTHAGAGPANVKTVNGIAIASVKTVNGIAIASVKTINGIA